MSPHLRLTQAEPSITWVGGSLGGGGGGGGEPWGWEPGGWEPGGGGGGGGGEPGVGGWEPGVGLGRGVRLGRWVGLAVAMYKASQPFSLK